MTGFVFGKVALRTAIAVTALLQFACAPMPAQRAEPKPERSRTSLPVESRPSPNFDARRPNFVIIHHTSDRTAEDALRTLTDPVRQVSAHYLISRDGRIYHLVDENARAWHAGESYWGGHSDLNSASIGIELDNDGREPFAAAQVETLLALLADLKSRFNIPDANFLGHGDIAPGRKVDPSRLFPWKRLADAGYGLWCEPPYPSVPADVETPLLLQAFGYNVWNLNAAVSAFKQHFVPDDPTPQMTEKDRSVLYCLVLQKRAVDAQ